MFKVGDIVECIESHGKNGPVKGRKYRVMCADATHIGIVTPNYNHPGVANGSVINWGNDLFKHSKEINNEYDYLDAIQNNFKDG